MNRSVALALWIGTFTGAGLCLAAAVAKAVGLAASGPLAHAGVIAILLTPPLRLAVTVAAFRREGGRRYALTATAVLVALVAVAIRALVR